MIINSQLFGNDFESDRIKILTVRYRTPQGEFFAFIPDNNALVLDANTTGYAPAPQIKVIGAFYGNRNGYADVMSKLDHYSYFRQTELCVNHESFPSPVDSDGAEYLVVVYINREGIHTVSCAEGEKLCFNSGRMCLYAGAGRRESHILRDIMQLDWGSGIDCTWAGALYAALKHMGRDVSYEYIMGVSGACFRIAFAPVWDFSSADALVVYDYAGTAYKALGYRLVWADRIDKEQRKEERRSIVRDIKAGKPPIAINLRVAPEWGVIAGYLDSGQKLLCRTYFDKAVFDAEGGKPEFIEEMKETGGYLYADCWPFAIAHFGEETAKLPERETLLNSLRAKVESMALTERRGYKMGFEAYKAWRDGLLDSSLFESADPKDIERRLKVNDYQLINLTDARRCAALYLKDSAGLLERKINGHDLGDGLSTVMKCWRGLAALHALPKRAWSCMLP